MSKPSLSVDPDGSVVKKSCQENKFILDATAGFRMMWFNKHHPNAIYIDSRPECEPDIVGDFRNLTHIGDKSFRLVVFDPPHIFKSRKTSEMALTRDYGYLERETWQADLKQAFKELWRVLCDYGVLIFKWNTAHIASSEILKLIPETPLFYQISSSRNRITVLADRSEGSGHVKTLWFCFMKIPDEAKP